MEADFCNNASLCYSLIEMAGLMATSDRLLPTRSPMHVENA